jgi:hypothetical protein
LVEDLPRALRSDAALFAYFDDLWPGQVHSAKVQVDCTALEPLLSRRAAAAEALESALATWAAHKRKRAKRLERRGTESGRSRGGKGGGGGGVGGGGGGSSAARGYAAVDAAPEMAVAAAKSNDAAAADDDDDDDDDVDVDDARCDAGVCDDACGRAWPRAWPWATRSVAWHRAKLAALNDEVAALQGKKTTNPHTERGRHSAIAPHTRTRTFVRRLLPYLLLSFRSCGWWVWGWPSGGASGRP